MKILGLVFCAFIASSICLCLAESTNKQERSIHTGPPTLGGSSIDQHIIPIQYCTANHIKTILDQMIDFLVAENGLKGKVKIVADDRTNILIILSEPANMVFFEKMIRVLDVEVENVGKKPEKANKASEVTINPAPKARD